MYWTTVRGYDALPHFHVAPDILSFEAEDFGANPAAQKSKVKNSGTATLNYTVSADQSWISVSPTSGSSVKEEDEITVNIDISSLTEGTHTGNVIFTSAKASNSPKSVGISVKINPPHIYEPQNFAGEKIENKSLFYKEIVHKLTWQHDARNKKIVKYLLYEVIGGVPVPLAELDSGETSYTLRNMLDKAYTYRIIAKDERGRTGDSATVTIQ